MTSPSPSTASATEPTAETITTPTTTPTTSGTGAGAPAGDTAYRMSPEHRRVFAGLMLGMLVASISQTIVGPGMPRIVADLGGMEHYSWVATAAMLVSAVSVPVVGKLSDLYGRRSFYLGGLVVFMIGSIICGLAPDFWTLVVGRAVQGLGMGTLMPLSQTIIGDLVPPRARGKYQGIMGAIFGLTSVAGPLAGGFITDHWGWRWLFFAALPVGVFALVFIARFLHLPHQRREAKIDGWGILTLTVSLTTILLATSWGGTTYAWSSATILGLYAVGAVFLAAFLWVEGRVAEPVLPLRLFRDRTIAWSSVAAFGLAMVMFGAIIYIPVYAQGVLGVDATNSGLILMPMMISFVVLGIVVGFLVTRTGHYKPFMLAGVAVMAVGIWLLTRLGVDSTQTDMTVAMTVLGVGLGLAMQLYTLVVQNVVAREDLGVATASTQFFRNVGSTVGIAIFGSVMTTGLSAAILRHLPEQVRDAAGGQLSHADAGMALDPAAMQGMPPVVLDAVRAGLAERLHDVFLLGLPVLAVVFVATALIPFVPLRTTTHHNEDAQRELLDSMGDTPAETVDAGQPTR